MMGQLGQASAASAVNVSQIVTSLCGSSPNYCTWKSGANKQGGLEAFLTQAVETCYLPDPSSDATATAIFDASFSCATGAASGASAATQASAIAKGVATGAGAVGTVGAATGLIAAGTAAAAAIPVVGIVAGIAALITGIFSAHHAAAVQGEAQDICSAVPQVNQVLAQIDSGLASGQISPSDAQSLYSQLQSQFSTSLHQNTTFKTGDTLWAFNLALQGIIQARTALLNAGQLVGGGTIPSGAAAAIGAATGISPLYLALGALAALYFFL